MLGLLSIFLGFVGIIPLLAIIFSTIGLKWKDKRTLAIIGLVLGIIYFTSNLYQYGHLDFISGTSEKQETKLDTELDKEQLERIEYKIKWCKKDCVYFPTKESWGYNPLFSMHADLLEFHNIIPEKADQFFPTEEKCIDYCIDWQHWSNE
ncbi:MAG: DUF4190 domain-containing protein [Parcubacteria group bacterium]|nr:DUF4190 domain-containing protein [Parcubacteria group bacterium]